MRSRTGRRRSRPRRPQKPKYTALKLKVYSKLVVLAFAASVCIFFLRELVRGRIGNFLVGVIERRGKMAYEDARDIYIYYILRNMDVIIYAAIAAAFVFLLWFMMSQFARYFNEISGGLNVLVEDRQGEIQLSPEMMSMEHKLNVIRKTLKQREQNAKEAERRKDDLVTYLAHDIRTPLTSVIGYLSLLDEEPDMPADKKEEYVRVTLDKAKRLERLIEEFFEITRYNLQTIVLSEERIDLCYMLMQMTDEFYPLLSAKGMRVELRAAEDLTVYGDPDKLARVFNNILRNAVEYGPENDVIEITAAPVAWASRSKSGRYSDLERPSKNSPLRPAPVPESVVITFKNTGDVPREKLALLFDKFYRLDSARSTGTGGAGLGLAIAKEIVTAHGGEIRADSDGGFTRFTVTLPMA